MRSKAPLIAALAAALLMVAGGVAIVLVDQSGSTTDAAEAAPTSSAPPVLDPSTNILDDGGPDAVEVVEFVDFACDVCGTVYTTMEDIRQRYAGQITFAIRYFPIASNVSSDAAALAAEAAAQQGQLDAMYTMLFDTRAQWAATPTSEAARFRGFAEQLGLDMAAYDAAVASQATADRIEFDVQAGQALGVASIPSIVIDGQWLSLRSVADIEAGIVAALAER